MSNTARWCAAVTLVALFCRPTAAQDAAGSPPAAAPPNTWFRLNDGVGDRDGFDLFYVPELKAFLAAGGYIGRGNPPYQEQVLRMEAPVWENHFPRGRQDWGPKVGPLDKAPGGVRQWKHWGVHMFDAEGNDQGLLTRGATKVPGQAVWDPVNRRALFYAFGRLAAYDPLARAWTDLRPAGDEIAQPLRWTSQCHIPTTREVLLAGGNCLDSNGTPGTWLYGPDANTWRRLATDRPAALIQAERCRGSAAFIETIARNRLHVASRPDDKMLLPPPIVDIRDRALAGRNAVPTNETVVRRELDRAIALLEGPDSKDALSLIRSLHQASECFEAVINLLDAEPAARANSAMAYDPKSDKVVLFGGDHLDYLMADTWLFDPKAGTWQQRYPPRSPAPRGGHAMLTLPKSGRVLLIGGYAYAAEDGHAASDYVARPLEIWLYDAAADRWDLLKRWELPEGRGTRADFPVWPRNTRAAIAANDDDVLVVAFGGATWAIRIDPAAIDREGSEKFGVSPATIARRGGMYDPTWWDRIDPPDPAANEKRLAELPPNAWVRLEQPKTMNRNRDWGTAVWDSDRRQILQFCGGHAAYSGTDVALYSSRANTWRLSYAPEFPIEFCRGDGYHGQNWTFNGTPLKHSHTYKLYAYDPVAKAMVLCNRDYVFTFDPAACRWSEPKPLPFVGGWNPKLCTTPQGVVAWAPRLKGGRDAGGGLWRWSRGDWQEIKLDGDPLPAPQNDDYGTIVYDTKRKRLLMFNADRRAGFSGGWSCEPDSGRVSQLAIENPGAGPRFVRETIYLPAGDLVLFGSIASADDASSTVVAHVYDVAASRFRGLRLRVPSTAGRFRGFGGHSCGLIHDPGRDLAWAVYERLQVFVMRFDPARAELVDLNETGNGELGTR